MRFGVLGPLAVWDPHGRLVDVPETKVRALLAILLTHWGHPVSADRLVEDLWEGAPPGRPLNTLQTKVSQLRRALGRDRVLLTPAGYRLDTAADSRLDAAEFADLVARARAARELRTRSAFFGDALGLWRGAAYTEVADAPFAREETARLEELRLTVVEERAETRLELGEHRDLADELGGPVERHPLRERLRAAHMRALYRTGRRGEALDSYEDLRRRLAEEFGADPGPDLSSLHAAILRHAPSAVASVAGLPRAGLPLPPTPLIGRDAAVADLRTLLSGDAHRIVTLTGPGGVGKTRLAVAVARSAADDRPDGAWLVELAGLRRDASPGEVAERVIATLGLCDTTADDDPIDLVAWLCTALTDRCLLLLLDNCEHVVDSAAAVAAALSESAPGVHLLTTSREPLDVPGETVRPVPPLDLPDGIDAGTFAERSSAVRLFAARAAAAVPGFRIDADNAAAVAAICHRLDGVPLALELVAPRLRVLSPRRIADALDDRFSLPTGPGRGRPARQQTLWAMIDWSWELLDGTDRAVLRRLAVHADGCTLRAAEDVSADGRVPAERVLGVLSRLVDRSLVSREGERFRLTESVAAYALRRLDEAGELAGFRRRFVDFHVRWAEETDDRLRGHGQGSALALLDAESVNARRALDSALRDADADRALRLVNALSWYWVLRGRHSEARGSLRAAIDLTGGAPEARAAAEAWSAGMEGRPAPVAVADPRLGARLRWLLGGALYRAGRTREGADLVERALADARTAADPWGRALALAERAEQRLDRGETRAAEADAETSADLFRGLGDRWGALRARRPLARLAELRGDRVRAAALLHEDLAAAEDLGLWVDAVGTLTRLGRWALADDDTGRAERLYRRALEIAAERSFTRGEVRAGTGLGRTALRRGDRDGARAHLGRAVELGRALGLADEAAALLAETTGGEGTAPRASATAPRS